MGKVSKITEQAAEAVLKQLNTKVTEKALSDLLVLAESAFLDDGDREYGLKLTKDVKRGKMVYYKGNREACFQDDTFWRAVLIEAQNRVVDSYFLYLERKREFKDMFYLPRRKVFLKHGITQMFQDLVDDKLDIGCLSMPPGTGKAQPLYSKVLTPNGFANMGDIHIGDKVIAGNGNIANVIGVYPQGRKAVYEVCLTNGAKCRCTDNHLWYVKDKKTSSANVVKFSKIKKDTSRYMIPAYVGLDDIKGQAFVSIRSVKYIGEEECQCIMIDDPCHLYITDNYIVTHNTSAEKFFNSAIIGWFPDDYNLFYSHSSEITDMYYRSVQQILTDEQEYAWHEIFPQLKVTSTNAKAQSLNVGKYKPFGSLQCASVGSENAGKVRSSYMLFVDDMIGKLEEAVNKNILDKLWSAYTVDARQRKTKSSEGKFCKELHIATRWSVHDVIGRLERAYEGNDRVRFIRVPDINPKTGESNFLYEIGGFTVQDFDDQALLMDDVSYRCLYKQEPVEREGLLYPEDSLRRFLELPNREPDAILGICDTKGKGEDYLFLPCCYQYGDDYYLNDCICSNNADYEVQYGRMINLIVENNMQQCEFESNRDGDRVAYEVSDRLKAIGARCNITTRYNQENKETKIIVNADWVKKHILFKDKSLYTPKDDYGIMMSFLTGHTVTGKNKFDDVPDGLASFALYVTKKQPMVTRIIQSPMW